MADLAAMMHDQLTLQIANGFNPLGMTNEERIAFIKENVLACTDELHEALNEIGWKSWATSRHINEEKAFGELRDAWQFLTNLMFAVTLDSPEQLAERLEVELKRKHAINHQRVTKGYDGVSSKCPHCKRALDETQMLVDQNGVVFCTGCSGTFPLSDITST